MSKTMYLLVGICAGAIMALSQRDAVPQTPLTTAARADTDILIPVPAPAPVAPVTEPAPRVIKPVTLPNRRGILGGTVEEPQIHGYPGIWKPPGTRPGDLNIYMYEDAE